MTKSLSISSQLREETEVWDHSASVVPRTKEQGLDKVLRGGLSSFFIKLRKGSVGPCREALRGGAGGLLGRLTVATPGISRGQGGILFMQHCHLAEVG